MIMTKKFKQTASSVRTFTSECASYTEWFETAAWVLSVQSQLWGKFQMTNFPNGFLREFKTPVKNKSLWEIFFLEASSETMWDDDTGGRQEGVLEDAANFAGGVKRQRPSTN